MIFNPIVAAIAIALVILYACVRGFKDRGLLALIIFALILTILVS